MNYSGKKLLTSSNNLYLIYSKMKRIIFFLVILNLTFCTKNHSQIAEPVKWNTSVKELPGGEAMLTFDANVQPKWHLYSQFFPEGGPIRLSFTFEPSKNYKLVGKVTESPNPKKEHDEIFGIDVQYFIGKATFAQKIKILSDKDFNVKVELEGQACSDEDGSCVMVNPDFEFKVKGFAGAKSNTQNIDLQEKVIHNDTKESENVDSLEKIKSSSDTVKSTSKLHLKRGGTTPIIVTENAYGSIKDKSSLIWFFFVSLALGLTALLTPCVFPMIPMTISFFMHGGQNKRKARSDALIYGISVILIYTLPIAIIIGIANIFGNTSVSGDFANFLSTHWLPNIFFFLIFMIFAASFLGMFEITMPSWLVNKSDQQVDKGGLLAPFFMAFTLVLVSFSCTGPIVGGIIVESTHGGDVIKPLVGMLGFSLGVAIPFTIFAFFPEWLKNLPKSGGWLNTVKVVLGFIELALGMKFLSVADQTYHWGLLDRDTYIALWIVIFFMLGMYLLGKLKFTHDSDLPHIKVPRLLIAIITFAFVVYLVPGMWGAPLKALSGYLPPKSSHDFDLVSISNAGKISPLCNEPRYKDELYLPHGLQGYFDVYQAIECSKQLNKPIFIDFTGHGCVNCREMEANVWSDPRVLQILRDDYIILALYVDDKKIELPENEWFTSTKDGNIKKSLGKQNADIQIVNFNINSQPYYVLLDYNGVVLAEPKVYDLDVNHFIKFLESGKKEFEKRNKK
jgi:thiol:disulfide interchange protein